ncbi:hypothetical protein [Burkholderia gladioli]|uniref:hypothetical protein n=1 Tax=Burkholderia gladioli TaxID=28095 RepID=UPI00163DF4E3|nr:hypothetical protein [Burkholderia gladioli]
MTDPNTTTPATLRADALELLREIAARKRYDPNAKVPWANNSGSITINLKSELLARVDALLDAAPAAPVKDIAPNVVEAIAEQWDGCMYAAPGIDIDIGEAIRQAATQFAAKQKRRPFASSAQAVAADGAACKGKNCGATDGVSHSPECVAEHEAAVTGAVAADGEAADDLLQLDVLLANLHAAVWHAGAGDDGPVDYDMAGKDEAKAIQRHVRAMLAERAAVSPATAEPFDNLLKQGFCDMGVGCREAGTCFAAAHGEPDRCTAAEAATADERAEIVEQCAKIADSFTCGACGMDGKVGAAIRASQAAAPAEAREPLVLWQDGTGMLWDTYSHGKWMHRFVSPHGWDAHGVAQHLYGKGYAGHLEVRAVWSGNYAVPADAGEAVVAVAGTASKPTGFDNVRSAVEQGLWAADVELTDDAWQNIEAILTEQARVDAIKAARAGGAA